MKKKILSALIITLLAVPMLVQCGGEKVTPEQPTIVNSLENYNEEGLNLLRTNYKTTEDMQLALENIGKDIGNLTFRTTLDKKVKVSSLKGKNIILSVAQDSCESCKISEPIIHEVAKGKDATVIPIFLNSTKEGIDGFYKEIGMEVPETVLIDDEKIIKNQLRLTKTPTLVYIDKDGVISLIKQEFKDKVSMEDDINLAFGEKKIYNYKK